MEISEKNVLNAICLCRVVATSLDATVNQRSMAFDLAMELSKPKVESKGKRVFFALGADVYISNQTLDAVAKIMAQGPTYKIAAIKELRMLTGLGLRDAKDCVESPKVFPNAFTCVESLKVFPNAFTTDYNGARISDKIAKVVDEYRVA